MDIGVKSFLRFLDNKLISLTMRVKLFHYVLFSTLYTH